MEAEVSVQWRGACRRVVCWQARGAGGTSYHDRRGRACTPRQAASVAGWQGGRPHPDLAPVSSLSPEVWLGSLRARHGQPLARRPSILAPRFANPHGGIPRRDPDEGEGGKVENLAASASAAPRCPQSQSAKRGGVPRPPPLGRGLETDCCPGRHIKGAHLPRRDAPSLAPTLPAAPFPTLLRLFPERPSVSSVVLV